jgi:hypothetical protein
VVVVVASRSQVLLLAQVDLEVAAMVVLTDLQMVLLELPIQVQVVVATDTLQQS